ncbi:hypothetical protein [Streptomyces sp. CA-106131]|uniref:hypothetical protein n=1 Tax=Streptomyces sp. CA-106131 TaxID=3240045 RepID=UPI003D8AE647
MVKRSGLAGSPTILIGGRAPFTEPGATPSLSCRIYPLGHPMPTSSGRPSKQPPTPRTDPDVPHNRASVVVLPRPRKRAADL